MSHQHPLQNSLILQSISQYVSLADLCKFRLVCEQWNDIGKMAVKKGKKITFTSMEHIQKFLLDMRDSSYIVPFSIFDISNINVSPIVEDFFQTIQNVTELTLRFSGDNSTHRSVDFETLQEILRLTCNTLQFLDLSCVEATFLRARRLYPMGEGLIPSELCRLTNLKLFVMCNESPGMFEFLTALFKSAPMLTDISCCSFCCSAASTLKAIALKKNISFIKYLVIVSNETSDVEFLLTLFRSHDLRLTTLKLVVDFAVQKVPIAGNVMTQLLSTQKDCLKYLKIGMFNWEGTHFPVMSNLTTLSLTVEVNNYSKLFFQQLRQITPNLKKIELPVDASWPVVVQDTEIWTYLDRIAIESRSSEADPTYPAAAVILSRMQYRNFRHL